MKRTILRIVLGIVALGAVGAGLAWARPDLLASLANLKLPAGGSAGGDAVVSAPGTAEEPPVETIDDGWCSAHNLPEARCPQCAEAGPGTPRLCLREVPVIRLSGPEIAARIGLETVRVEGRMHADTILGNAEITYNEHAYAEVRPRVRGLVSRVEVDHGDLVKKGQELVVIDSAEVGTDKANYLATLPVVELAQATLDRTRALTRSNALPMKDELVAQTDLNRVRADLLNATQRLRNFGFTDSDLVAIARDQDTSSLLTIASPIDGTIVERQAVPGEAVEPTDPLIIVADVRRMWCWIDVYENEIERVKPAQKVTFRIAGVEGQEFGGEVEYIDTAVNPATRTIRVRALIDNPDGRLRANQFGQAEILVGKPHRALFVTHDAIQVVDGTELVFLPQPDGSYHPQRILLEQGENLRGEEEVLWGLKEGQEVVTTGSFLLKSELLKDQLVGE